MAGSRTGPVAGVVLAAGRSTRMGRPKAALELDGATFLGRTSALLRDGGCRAVVVVLGARPDAAEAPDGVILVVNPDPASQPIDSLRIALGALPADSIAAAVLPVDAPAVRPATVRRLLEAFRGGTAAVVRPVYRGRPGHPTLFARSLFAELASGPLAAGAETVVERHAPDRLDVDVDDPAVVGNINTPEEYRRLVEGS